jgi:polysaccharide export outer membrane protein
LLDGKSRKEAAGQLGWSEGTLSGRLARAKELLGARLRRRGVALTALGLAAALAEVASAKVPASLALATVKTATSLAGRDGTGTVSIQVFALMEEVMKAMLVSKLKAVAGVLLVLAGLGFGAAFACQYGPPSASAPRQPDSDARTVETPEKAPKAKAADYIIEPPDVLLVKYASADGADPVKIDGQRLVRPDGTIGLGQLGSVVVTGRTLTEAHDAIARHLARRLDGFESKKLTVELFASNSKVFYVITRSTDGTSAVYRLPASGNQTVLDAILAANVSLIGLGQRRISLHCISDDGKSGDVRPVNWEAITLRGDTTTNYSLQPGDRLHIESPPPKESDGNGVKIGVTDALQKQDAILRALRNTRSPEDQQRLIEELELNTRRALETGAWKK